MAWNTEQMALCKQLSKKLPPNYVHHGAWNLDLWKVYDGSSRNDYPLFNIGELLELVKKPLSEQSLGTERLLDAIYSDDMLTALLKLAVEVMEGEGK